MAWSDPDGLLRDGLAVRCPALRDVLPVNRDFRAGDVLHSQAEVGKAVRLLGYEAMHTIADGLREALDWYESSLNLEAVFLEPCTLHHDS